MDVSPQKVCFYQSLSSNVLNIPSDYKLVSDASSGVTIEGLYEQIKRAFICSKREENDCILMLFFEELVLSKNMESVLGKSFSLNQIVNELKIDSEKKYLDLLQKNQKLEDVLLNLNEEQEKVLQRLSSVVSNLFHIVLRQEVQAYLNINTDDAQNEMKKSIFREIENKVKTGECLNAFSVLFTQTFESFHEGVLRKCGFSRDQVDEKIKNTHELSKIINELQKNIDELEVKEGT